MRKVWTELQGVVILLKVTSLNIKMVGGNNKDTKQVCLQTFEGKNNVQKKASLLSRGWRNYLVLRVPSGSWASLWEEKQSRHRHSERRKPPDCRRQFDLWSDRCPLRCPGPSTPGGTCVAGARQSRLLAVILQKESASVPQDILVHKMLKNFLKTANG